MSKKVGYAETRLVKSKQKHKNKFVTLMVCVLSLAMVVLLSGVLAGAITVGNFSNLFQNKSNTISAHSYYMVSMGKYNSRSEAEAVASGAAVMGASAYVWELNKMFYVVGNIYKNSSEADSVLKNISGTGNYEISVEEIKFKKLTISNKEYSNEQIKAIVEAIKSLNNIYEKCYDYSLKVDKGEVNTGLVSSELNSIKSEAKITAAKLDAINSYAVSELTINTKNAFISVVDALDNAILKVISGNSVNGDLRCLVSKIVVAKYNLYQNI